MASRCWSWSPESTTWAGCRACAAPPICATLLGGDDGGSLRDALVTGPLCTTLDSWARGVTAPAVRPGDLVSVPNVGAYGLYASLVAFLGHPLPVEVVLDGGRITSVTRLGIHRAPVRSDSVPEPDLTTAS